MPWRARGAGRLEQRLIVVEPDCRHAKETCGRGGETAIEYDAAGLLIDLPDVRDLCEELRIVVDASLPVIPLRDLMNDALDHRPEPLDVAARDDAAHCNMPMLVERRRHTFLSFFVSARRFLSSRRLRF